MLARPILCFWSVEVATVVSGINAAGPSADWRLMAVKLDPDQEMTQ